MWNVKSQTFSVSNFQFRKGRQVAGKIELEEGEAGKKILCPP